MPGHDVEDMCALKMGRIHVLDLSPHGQYEEYEEVHHEDGPVHGHIEGLRKRAEEGNDSSTC